MRYRAIAVALVLVVAPAAPGAFKIWNNLGAGYWHDPANWNFGSDGPPASGDTVGIGNGGLPTIINPAAAGAVNLNGGSVLTIESDLAATGPLRVGELGAGTIVHSAGTAHFSGLQFGDSFGHPGGSYSLSGGARLETTSPAYIGKRSPATFTQSGGQAHFGGDVHVGWGRSSTYSLAGGSFESGRVTIANADHPGYAGSTSLVEVGDATMRARSLYVHRRSYNTGIFRITNAGASITVDEYIKVWGGWEAVPGSSVTLGGSLLIGSKVPSAVAGLANTSFTFAGATAHDIEAGAADLGSDPFAKAAGDFFYAGVSVEPGGTLYVTDTYDNQSDGGDNEVLYVSRLTLGPGSTLNLYGRTVYAMDVSIDPTATITDTIGGGQFLPFVPAPGAAALLAAGALLATRRRR